MWHCMNLVCGPEGSPSGVLLRAGEILSGHEWAHKHRPNARNDIDVCVGPQSPLAILTGAPAPADQVLSGPRTGVGGEGATHPYRFWIDGDPTVSPYRAHTPRRRKSDAPSDAT
jgi:DNA-3-methyladenine glycosylase